jgi:hypothetical protein
LGVLGCFERGGGTGRIPFVARAQISQKVGEYSLCAPGGQLLQAALDPMDIAARCMAQRQVIAEAWIQALGDTDEDQLNIQREFMTECLSVSSFVAILERLIKKNSKA